MSHTHPRRDTKWQLALELAARPGGVVSTEMLALGSFPGMHYTRASGILGDLKRAGHLHAVPTGIKRQQRYFADPAHMQAWAEQNNRDLAAKRREPKKHQPPGWSASAQGVGRMNVKLQPDAPVVHLRGGVKVIQCPSAQDTRYTLPPGTRVVGGFYSEWLSLRGQKDRHAA